VLTVRSVADEVEKRSSTYSHANTLLIFGQQDLPENNFDPRVFVLLLFLHNL